MYKAWPLMLHIGTLGNVNIKKRVILIHYYIINIQHSQYVNNIPIRSLYI